MPSPFPGMDPYLESDLWPDLHQRLAGAISALLTPRLAPHYVARLVTTVVSSEPLPDDVEIMYPDVEVVRRPLPAGPGAPVAVAERPRVAPPALEVFTVMPLPVKLVNVEVRDARNRTLITAIEILSPFNKRTPDHAAYRRKRNAILTSAVHLLEIDLLRAGARPPMQARLPGAPYFVFLSRAGRRPQTEVWPVGLREALPVVPVPLRLPDPDVPLDLQAAFNTCYNEARYDLDVDYSLPPDPLLSESDAAWAAELLAPAR
ncbi:MAG: DUF4058 family protein [Chloroflexi bacterium]|nr:DUF4058 family protein [Chloroflexota bacterium]